MLEITHKIKCRFWNNIFFFTRKWNCWAFSSYKLNMMLMQGIQLKLSDALRIVYINSFYLVWWLVIDEMFCLLEFGICSFTIADCCTVVKWKDYFIQTMFSLFFVHLVEILQTHHQYIIQHHTILPFKFKNNYTTSFKIRHNTVDKNVLEIVN